MGASSWLTALAAALLAALAAALASAPAFAQSYAPPAELDRYGGEVSSTPPARFLDWAGKTPPPSLIVEPRQAGLSVPGAPQGSGSPPDPRAAAAPSSVRYYTMHRDYHLQPDPIPVPPQFFGPTADLSQPPADANPPTASGHSKAGAFTIQVAAGDAP